VQLVLSQSPYHLPYLLSVFFQGVGADDDVVQERCGELVNGANTSMMNLWNSARAFVRPKDS